MTTVDLSKFGRRELAIAGKLLTAYANIGLGELHYFHDENVTVMLNQSSGFVFLTNEDLDVAMLNSEGDLEEFYTTPYGGVEGFLDELIEQFDDLHKEDKDFVRERAGTYGRADELPEEEEEDNNARKIFRPHHNNPHGPTF